MIQDIIDFMKSIAIIKNLEYNECIYNKKDMIK